jgi:GTP cyclohydrolase IB
MVGRLMIRSRKAPAIDVQSQKDHRKIPIDKVGVKDILYPITVLDRAQGHQQTVARVSMYVNLPHQFKGTHMSRFVELLNQHRHNMTTTAIPTLLMDMRIKLKARTAHLEVSFPYFILKRAPVSRAEGLLAYQCTVRGTANHKVDLEIEVQVPITALCPCSKAISDQGAHNQRGMVTVRYRPNRFVWIEEIIDMVESSASCEIFSVLKREDEKYVTEKAYAKPMFVEDVARTVAQKLLGHPRITWFSVEVENQESIHAHNAYAQLERTRASTRRGRR